MLLNLFQRILSLPSRMPYYAVRAGRNPGIYSTWDECKQQIDKFPAARYKKFNSEDEARSFVGGATNKVCNTVQKSPQSSNKQPRAAASTPSQIVQGTSGVQNLHGNKAKSKQTSSSKGSSSNTNKSELQKQIAATEVQLFNERLSHQENEERLQLKEQRLALMKDRLESSKQSTAGKVKKTKAVSSHQKKPYSRPSNVSSSNWSQNRSTQLIDLEEARNIHTSSQHRAGEDTGDGDSGAVVYTDGACVNNGRDNPCAGIGVYWGPGHPLNVSEKLEGRQTNNRAEIYAVVRAAKQARDRGLQELTVKTDSQFLINSMTKWLPGWQKKGWITAAGKPVINREDFEALISASHGLKINWVHVKGHQGVEGNECADQLAVQGTKK